MYDNNEKKFVRNLTENAKKMSKNASTQHAVWHQSGCMFAESFVGILKFRARSNFSVPPPAKPPSVIANSRTKVTKPIHIIDKNGRNQERDSD